MSIASEIQRINNNIASAYSQCQSKGATMPATQNSDNLANTISTISGGGGADLNDYFNTTLTSSADFGKTIVKRIPRLTIASGITSLTGIFSNTTFTELAFDGIDMSGITDLQYGFSSNSTSYWSNLKKIDLANITNTDDLTSVRYLFYQQINLESVSNMFSLSGNVQMGSSFANCQKLKTLDLSNWKCATGTYGGAQMFRYTYKLAYLDISGITFSSTSNSNAFQDCGRDCLQSDGAYADGIPYVYVKDSDAQSKVLSSGNVPASWSTNNVKIKSS